MKLQIQSIRFDADISLVNYVQKKCNKLDTFFDRITDGVVYLRLEGRKGGENKEIEILLNLPDDQLIARERGRKFEEATDLAVDNLKRQLRKYKERFKIERDKVGALVNAKDNFGEPEFSEEAAG